MSGEGSDQTLQPTALVHEAYVRLLGDGSNRTWASPGHFFAAAAEAMRRILVERARRKGRCKHGGGRRRVELESIDVAEERSHDELLALDEALALFAREHSEKAELVKLRYFAGLTTRQAAEVMGISTATAERHWSYARAWLYRRVASDSAGDAHRRAGRSDA
jgi:RNA polymerase sigma factor (TIGR02999 family)